MIRKGEFLTLFTPCLLVLLASVTSQAQSAPPVAANVARPSTSSTGLSSLPADAQGPISAKLGKDDSRYWFHDNTDGVHAENAQQALTVDFTQRGAEVHSQNMHWWLQTSGYGYGDTLFPVSAAAPEATSNMVEYQRGGMTEWYANGPLGLEQGFTLAKPPGKPNGQPLTLALALSGDLVAGLEPSRTALALTGNAGRAALRYSGLTARDATGRELPSWLELRGQRLLLLRVDDRGARYPLVVDPWMQQAELTASDGAFADEFGLSVAVSGNTAVVGAPGDGPTLNEGAAYVFVRKGGTWTQQTGADRVRWGFWRIFRLVCSGERQHGVVGAFGHYVGSNQYQGAAYVFVRSGTTWSQQAELTEPEGAEGDYFGNSVAVSGNTAVVGAPYHTVGSNFGQGAAYVFVRSGITWKQQQELTESDGADQPEFGYSVAVNGSTVVVGAPYHTVGSKYQQGAAYVFVRSGRTWSQQAELTASDGKAADFFGWSVAGDSSTVVVGSPGVPRINPSYKGAAYVFVDSGTTWNQQAELRASDGEASDEFGLSVAVSGPTAVVGAPNHLVDSNQFLGAVYAFVQNGTKWMKQAELVPEGTGYVGSGFAVAVDGSTLVGGLPVNRSGRISARVRRTCSCCPRR